MICFYLDINHAGGNFQRPSPFIGNDDYLYIVSIFSA